MKIYLDEMLSIALFALPVYAILRIIVCKSFKVRRNIPREIFLGVFAVFTVALLILVLQDDPGRYSLSRMWQTATSRVRSGKDINLIPFGTIRRFWSRPGSDGFMINIVGNIAMFIPVGLLLPLLWKRWQSFGKIFLAGLLLPVMIEFCQLFLGRSVDIDDVLLNLGGVLLGYGLYCLIKKLLPRVQALSA